MNLMSENISELMSALSKAQGKIQPAAKDKANPFFKSKYADLSSVWEACRAPLSENGLAVTQTVTQRPEGMTLITILGHASGQWIKSEMVIIISKPDPQALGSALTYFRRYSLAAIVGVAPDDDDGEKAQSAFRNEKDCPQKNKKPVSILISKEELADLESVLEECPDDYRAWLLNLLKTKDNISELSQMPKNIFIEVKKAALNQMLLHHQSQNQFAQEVQ